MGEGLPFRVRQALMRAVEDAGSQKAFAERVGVSAQFLHDVLRDRRNANAEILDAIGYERVVTYRKKEVEHG